MALKEKNLITSSLGRIAKVSSLVGRVGGSVLGNETVNLFRSKVSKKLQKAKNLSRNADRIVETLGNMKGGVMKLGQMLSLQEDLLPPEMSDVLRKLQKETPSIPYEKIKQMMQRELKDRYKLFEFVEPRAFAAASIGQVHRGTLKGGRKVAIKVQYPRIQQIIKSDLKNLKSLLRLLFSFFSQIDLDTIFKEVEERILEEIDYIQEASHIKRMRELYGENKNIHIPDVIEEASSKRVLTMEFMQGIGANEEEFEEASQKLKNQWAEVLFRFITEGVFKHHYLHADPNLANFNFNDDGSVIVYDFGCVKDIPENIYNGFANLARCVLEDRKEDIPSNLEKMGIKLGEVLVPMEFIDPFYTDIRNIFRKSPPYTFDQNQSIVGRVMEFKKKYWNKAFNFSFPQDIIFVDRAIAGHFGNFGKFKASGNWNELISPLLYNESCHCEGFENTSE